MEGGRQGGRETEDGGREGGREAGRQGGRETEDGGTEVFFPKFATFSRTLTKSEM